MMGRVMDGEVLLTLSIAKLYAHHANFAGTPREAITDGYSAVDAVFTALLRQDLKPQPKNHKQKLAAVRENYPDAFAAVATRHEHGTSFSPGTDWESLEAYYREWLASRYGSFEMSAAAASARVREALNVVSAGIRFIANKKGISPDLLEEQVSTKAFGFDFSAVSVAVGDAHDRLFTEAEAVGEMHGSRLGTKLAATTNYCELDVMTGDEFTQRLISEDKEIAEEAARAYHSFVSLIDRIQTKRLERISGGKPLEECSPDEIVKAPDFMFSMKARYHGGTALEMGARWFGTIGKGLAEFLKNTKLGCLSM